MAATRARTSPFVAAPQFLEKYELGQLLGKGGFGSVYACKERATGKTVACKVLDREEVRRSLGVETSKEVGIMERLAGQHYGVIQHLDTFENEKHTYVVMELCTGGSLLDILKAKGAMPEDSARAVLGQVAAALAYCHSQRILHLDIKPENIFFTDPPASLYDDTSFGLGSPFFSLDVRTRLADFGMATVLRPKQRVRGDVGSPHFKAPEIVSGDRFGLEVDVWSLGVVLCVMLTGAVPFLGTSNHDTEGLNRAIMSGHVNFTSARWWNVSPEAKNLVSRMLHVDPKQRIKAAEILEHPWFTSPFPAEEKEILPAFAREEIMGKPKTNTKTHAVASLVFPSKPAVAKHTSHAPLHLKSSFLRAPKVVRSSSRFTLRTAAATSAAVKMPVASLAVLAL